MEAPVLGKTVSKTGIAAVVEEEVRPVHDVRPAQGEGAKTKSRGPGRRLLGLLSRRPHPNQSEAEMTVASVALSKVAQRRMTKRLAAAAHLQRDERWKRRLHPAAW